MTASLQLGMHWIMRKYKSYTHFDFMYGREGKMFYSSTFFQLINMIKYEQSQEEKRYKKMESKNKRGK